MSEKMYIKIDKPIEVGDLVRCMGHDWPFKGGDIRKVRRLHRAVDSIFFVYGSDIYLDKTRWQPVHKMQVGDQVHWNGNGRSYTVKKIYVDKNMFSVEEAPYLFDCDDSLELHQPEKHDTKPVQVIEDHTAEMERAVGRMIVELMDRAEKKKVMPRIYCYRNEHTDKTTRVYFDDEGYDAKLHPDDTWDTLTGVFVALSKAAGHKLPDWIYGEKNE